MSVTRNQDPTLVKERGQAGDQVVASQEIEEWLAVGLALIAGFIDAYGIITYETFVSFMSGNTTHAGYHIGQGNFGEAAHAAVAIVSFVGGSFAGALLAHSAVGRIRRLVFGVIATGLVLIIGFAQFGYLSGGIHIGTVSFTMGAMNTALSPGGTRSRVGVQSASLTFVTGTLSRIGLHLALAARRAPLPNSQGAWDTHLHRALLLVGIWTGFLGGRTVVGGSDTALWRMGFVVSRADPGALAAFDRTASTPI
jgi:uncharacterized membrane protein YoaK (UPF0700 family)